MLLILSNTICSIVASSSGQMLLQHQSNSCVFSINPALAILRSDSDTAGSTTLPIDTGQRTHSWSHCKCNRHSCLHCTSQVTCATDCTHRVGFFLMSGWTKTKKQKITSCRFVADRDIAIQQKLWVNLPKKGRFHHNDIHNTLHYFCTFFISIFVFAYAFDRKLRAVFSSHT